MTFLLFILVLGFVAVLAVVAGAWSLLRSFFGFGRTPQKKDNTIQHKPHRKREKFFKKNEGEYVDFEEVKEK